MRVVDDRWRSTRRRRICVRARARCMPELLKRSRRNIYDMRYTFALAGEFLAVILHARLAENRCDHWCVHVFTIGGRLELVHHHCASPPSLLAQSRRSLARVCAIWGVHDAMRTPPHAPDWRFITWRCALVVGALIEACDAHTLTHVLKVLTTGPESVIYRYVCMF